jgi:hypothetical protein
LGWNRKEVVAFVAAVVVVVMVGYVQTKKDGGVGIMWSLLTNPPM